MCPIRHAATLLLVSLVLIPHPAAALSTGFIENRGQVNEAVRYYLPGSDGAVYFTPQALVMDLKEHVAGPSVGYKGKHPFDPMADNSAATPETRQGCALYIRFDGGNPSPAVTAGGRLETQYSFFLGKDPSKWRSQVPAYAEVVYHDVWPGIDVAFHEDGGALAYEVVVHPGADAAQVAFRYEGARVERAGGAGDEMLETGVGTLDHMRRALAGKFSRARTQRSDQVEPGRPSLDNPAALLWSTFVGGNGLESSFALALDASGNAVVSGWTNSFDFPTTPGAYDTSFNGGSDVFVMKISSTGSALLWSTFLGGSGYESGRALALDASGNVMVTGATTSSDFPTTPGAYDTLFNGGGNYGDAFVAKLSSAGSALLWSTYLGGSGDDISFALALDSSGNAAVTGNTYSSDFPTTPGAYDTSFNGGDDVFVTEISATGSTLVWSTLLGGGDSDVGGALVLDPSGNAVVTGYTKSSSFPTTLGAYDTSWNGGYDVFVTKISFTGSALLWSTFLGGSADDGCLALALDASGNAMLAGTTGSGDFPTTPGAYDTSYNGGSYWGDAFVAKLSADGSTLLWSSFLGGSGDDLSYALALDASGNGVVAGYTYSSDFPTTAGAYDTSFNGGSDVFVTKISSTGGALLWGTFLGGSSTDAGWAMALDASGNAVVTGFASSSNFPTTPGAYDTSFSGGWDVFVSKLRLRHLPAAEYLPWDDFAIRPGAPAVGLVSVFPNSAGGGAVFRFASAPAEPITVRMFDVAGRLLRSLPQTVAAAGTQELVWDGRDAAGAQAKPGVYFYQVTIGAQIHTGKLVIAK